MSHVTTRSRGTARHFQQRYGYAFIAIPLFLFLVFTAVPVVLALGTGFTNYSVIGRAKWIGLANFRRLLADPFFGVALRNTLVYTAMYVPAGLLVALGCALVLNLKHRGVTVYRVFFYIPVVASTVASATMWYWLLNPTHGVINVVLGWFGVNGPAWLYSSRWAMTAIVMMSVWATFGTNMMLFLAGLQYIPRDLHEAAMIDGAGVIRRFWHVTWPGLRRTTFFVLLLLIIGAMQVFDQAYVLTQGGPGNSTITVVYYIYTPGFGDLRMGYASAMSFVLAVIILVFSVLSNRLTGHDLEAAS
ncbi:MAG: sugar ABC transporter permease [Propionibacteriaceae bacterium]|jgi:multiple sugar transport system permease protein|nr:sugar ABC transporter permease [Propionibacteriaceae bacterium]